jgi:GntR family transcriptional repressor for pyruvate dehydrogenase complex
MVYLYYDCTDKIKLEEMAKIIRAKRKLSDYVIDEIKRMLKSGELQEGSKLPNQNEFAQQLGVSRLPLREAMQKLRLMGVIEEKPGVGTHIVVGDPSLWGLKMEAPLINDAQATFEFIEARKSLELPIIKASINRVTKEELELLKKDVAHMEDALRRADRSEYLKYDMAFHLHLASASHNRYLLQMLRDVQNLLEQFMMEAFNEIPELLDDSMHHHKEILRHLINHETEKATKSMMEHICSIEAVLKKYYEQRNIAVPETSCD